MKRPGKKTIIAFTAAAVFLSVSLVILFAVIRPGSRKRYGPPPRITVNFPESGGGANAFRKILVPAAKKDKGFYIYEELLPEEDYSRLLPVRLKDPVNGDLYYVVNNGELRRLTKKGLIVSIPDDVRKKWKSAVPEVFLTLGPGGTEGPSYIPVSWYPWGFYYRKSVFKEAGIKPPESWKEFLSACGVLKSRGIIPVGMTGQVKWPLLVWFDYLNLRINGSDYHARWSSLEVPFTDQGIVRVVETIIVLREQGFLQTDFSSAEWETLPGDLAAGKTGMVLCGSFFMDKIPETQRDDYGWFPFPDFARSDKVEIISGAGFVLSAEAPNRDNALALLDYVLDDKFQKRFIQEKTGMFPVLPRLVKNIGRDDLSSGYDRAVDSKRLFEMSERGLDNRMIIPFKAVLNNFLTVDKKDAEAILRVLEEERRKILLRGDNA